MKTLASSVRVLSRKRRSTGTPGLVARIRRTSIVPDQIRSLIGSTRAGSVDLSWERDCLVRLYHRAGAADIDRLPAHVLCSRKILMKAIGGAPLMGGAGRRPTLTRWAREARIGSGTRTCARQILPTNLFLHLQPFFLLHLPLTDP